MPEEYKNKKFILFVLTTTLIRFLSKSTSSIYLLAIAALASELMVTQESAKIFIPIYVAGTFTSQFFIGPLSDFIGRRALLKGLLITYIVAALLITSVELYSVMVSLFFLLGFAGGSLPTLSNASLADNVSEGNHLAKILAVTSIAVIIAPAIAIGLGGMITDSFGWRYIFWILATCASVCLLLTFRRMPPTDKVARRKPNMNGILRSYAKILKKPTYLFVSHGVSFLGAGMAAYYACGIFILSQTLEYTSGQIAILTLFLVSGNIIGRVALSTFVDRVGARVWIIIGSGVAALSGGLMFVLGSFYDMNAFSLIIPMSFYIMGMGSIVPLCRSELMRMNTGSFGTSESLLGLIMAAVGTFISFIASNLSIESIVPLATLILFISSFGFVLLCFGFARESGFFSSKINRSRKSRGQLA